MNNLYYSYGNSLDDNFGVDRLQTRGEWLETMDDWARSDDWEQLPSENSTPYGLKDLDVWGVMIASVEPLDNSRYVVVSWDDGKHYEYQFYYGNFDNTVGWASGSEHDKDDTIPVWAKSLAQHYKHIMNERGVL